MIYFLYGPETFSSRATVRKIAAEFSRKTKEAVGFTRVDAAEEPAALLTLGRSRSLFSAKELVVIENASLAPAEVQGYLRDRLVGWQASRDLTVVFWEGGIGVAEGFPRELKRVATKSQEFKMPSAVAFGRFVDAAAQLRGLRLTAAERALLLSRHGRDLWAVANELDKMAAGWSLPAAQEAEGRIWDFTDAFLVHPRRAFRPLEGLLAAGKEPIYLLGALAAALNTFALAWWGQQGRRRLAGGGIHPYVLRKLAPLARRVAPAALRESFRRLAAADLEQKTGRLPPPLPLVKLVLSRRDQKPSA